MAAAAESASFEEEHVPNKKPRKECLLKGISNVPDSESEESEFYDVSRNKSDGSDPPADWAHVHPDLEDLDGEVSSMLEAVTFAELQTASVSEVEDWDKELEDFECSPYEREQRASGGHGDKSDPADAMPRLVEELSAQHRGDALSFPFCFCCY
nr:coordinator of PRMT5 and differentiation stimulator isoform X3 [Columba livia]